MGKFFSVDSPLYQFMNRLFDMLKLNFLWLLFSLPVVTMGAATTAAYTVTLRMVDDREGYIFEPFWKAFKANLKKGSIIGVILEVASYAAYLDFQLYHASGKLMFLIIGIVAIFLLVMHMVYAFPLLARYENSVINTLRNSYSIAAKYFGRTLFILVIVALEFAFCIWNEKMYIFLILLGPACMILTVSGMAMSLFHKIEAENEEMAAKAQEEENTSGNEDAD